MKEELKDLTAHLANPLRKNWMDVLRRFSVSNFCGY